MYSLWSETVTFPSFEALNKNMKTDVLIIGGGITGILTAHYLQQAGVNYILVEADTICSGITKNTTAKITSQHGLIYHKIAKKYGIDAAGLYLEANEAALWEYRKLTKEFLCDFVNETNYVYTLTRPDKLEQELDTLKKLRFPAEFAQNLPLPFPTAGAVAFPNQAKFHPLKFLAELAKPLHIYEHTKVQELVETLAVTNHGKIQADKIIVTTHFPFLNKHGSYFLKLYQHRSYVLALKDAPKPKGMYVDEADKGLSFRTHQNLLILGGGGHRTGKQGGNYNELRCFADKHFPDAKEVYHWATQDCVTLDGIPYIGQYSKHTPNLYVATGFNKWGMTSAMVAALLLRDLITGKKTPYADVFSPSRSIWHPKLFLNGFESSVNLLTPTRKRCPHLGCALKWNKAEHTWDCPCHGSRFTRKGELIDNPATDDLKE
ncbi:MAG: FAD-dependent oxidoreductase [Lachnospiraceae bacterium]|nr:FAD-dependent oxidoreductase [Lachnospiraceae bacterium]